MMRSGTLFYIHDPMCSWCWGYRPTWQSLAKALPAAVRVVSLLGGLAPDNDQPMPRELQKAIRSHWVQIHQQLGTEFNFDFWQVCQPRRDTYKACRAVVAAKEQEAEEEMVLAIQHAYYLRAMNPSDLETLVRIAVEIGLDEQRFEQDLVSASTDREFKRQMGIACSMGVSSYPSLVLVVEERVYPVQFDYLDNTVALKEIEAALQ